MKQKIIFATTNEGKMREIRLILEDLDVEVLSMGEAGLKVDIVEDGSTFAENALIKAKTISDLTGEIVLADDSGLEVDYINKEPGIYSARYLGDAPYSVKNETIIQRLTNALEDERTARFVCVIALAMPDGTSLTTEAAMEGQIAYKPAGSEGFGYDPIFFLKEFQCTAAQLTMAQKNVISHRGKALHAIKEKLKIILEEKRRDENSNCK